MKKSAPTSLKHHFLIAMPHMADPHFAQTVTYLVEHNEQGAMGLVINKPNGLNLADVLEQLRPDEEPAVLCHSLPIFAGGPVQTDRGFVLHPAGPQFQATLELGELGLSTSQDVLFAIADGMRDLARSMLRVRPRANVAATRVLICVRWWAPDPSQARQPAVSVIASAEVPRRARRCLTERSALSRVRPSRSAGAAWEARCNVRKVARSASVPR